MSAPALSLSAAPKRNAVYAAQTNAADLYVVKRGKITLGKIQRTTDIFAAAGVWRLTANKNGGYAIGDYATLADAETAAADAHRQNLL